MPNNTSTIRDPPRPDLPSRSGSILTGGPPADSAKPDSAAVEDVYEQVEATGSLEAAAAKLRMYARQQRQRQMWEDDPEEAEYNSRQGGGEGEEEELDDVMGDGDGEEDGDVGEVVHLQQVVEGLWIGDLVAAMDAEGLEARGITNILSLLRPALKFSPHFAVFPLEIDDSADTDIFSHLPSCVAWIHSALDKRRRSLDPPGSDDQSPPRVELAIGQAQQTKAGGVLVHCQAGMSRSATVVAAYLMTTLELDPMEAVEMIREKRPVVDPSDTFLHQLGLFYNADGRVSLRDRSTRQFYMERTTSQFINGDGAAPPMDKMARYPATPSASNPPTPMGGHGRRKIRCKMCRRQLAVREHMMDHILEQSPVSRPRTPSNFALPSPLTSFTSQADTRKTSAVSDVINPLTGLPGAIRSRHESMSYEDSSLTSSSAKAQPMSNATSSTDSQGSSRSRSRSVASPGVPMPRTSRPDLTLTTASPSTSPEIQSSSKLNGNKIDVPSNLAFGLQTVVSPLAMSPQISTDSTRQFQSAEQLASRLPPHLQALRRGSFSMSSLPSPIGSSPASSPERERDHSQTMPPSGGVLNAARKMSLLKMTAADGTGGSRRDSVASDSIATSGSPILVNPKCSGYFVEPLTWMEPVLRNGEIAGKLVCPNEKCGVKIGNYDWAGVQCGCKEWVTPGFCIHRSKVDEVW